MPDQFSALAGRKAGDVDAADAALLELDRLFSAHEPRSELAEVRLVTDERDVLRVLEAGERERHVLGCISGLELAEDFERGIALESILENPRRRLGPH